MGILDRLMGRSRASKAEEVDAGPCLHTALGPRWDSVEDMGNESKATAYTCSACSATFTPAEAAQLRESEAERLRRELG